MFFYSVGLYFIYVKYKMAYTRKRRRHMRNYLGPKALFRGTQYFKTTSIVNGKTVEDTELREDVDNNRQVIEGHIGSKPVHIRRRIGLPGSKRSDLKRRQSRYALSKANRYALSKANRKLSSRKLSRKFSSRKLKPLRFDI